MSVLKRWNGTAWELVGAAAAAPRAALDNTSGAQMIGAGTLDPRTGIYSPPGARTPLWRAQLGKALAGTGVAELVFIGPSTTMGAPTGVKVSPAKALVGILSARGVPVTDGYANTISDLNAPADASQDPRWSFPDGGYSVFSATTPYIPGAFNSGGINKRAVYTSSEKGTIAEWLVVGASGPYNWSIANPAGVVEQSGSVAAQATNTFTGVTQVTGLPYGQHVITLTPTAASPNVYVLKARIRNASGITINNAGWSGAAAEDWDKTDSTMSAWPGSSFALPYAAQLGYTSPPIVIIDAGMIINSYINSSGHTPGYTTALATAALQRIVGQWQAIGADILLLCPTAPSTTVQFGTNPATPIPDATFEPYRQVMYSIADQFGLFLLDDIERVGLWAAANANGLKADAFHNNAAGYAELAAGLSDLLLPATGPVAPYPTVAPAAPGKITANASTTNTAATDSGLAVTFPVVAGATYRVEAKIQLGNTLANIQATANLTDAANTIYDAQGYSPTVANGTQVVVLWAEFQAAATGNQTFKIRIFSAATGTAFLLAGATFPNVIRPTRVS